jgi:hypothetical protein
MTESSVVKMAVFIRCSVLYITPYIFYFSVTCHDCGLTQNSLLLQRHKFGSIVNRRALITLLSLM